MRCQTSVQMRRVPGWTSTGADSTQTHGTWSRSRWTLRHPDATNAHFCPESQQHWYELYCNSGLPLRHTHVPPVSLSELLFYNQLVNLKFWNLGRGASSVVVLSCLGFRVMLLSTHTTDIKSTVVRQGYYISYLCSGNSKMDATFISI